MKENKILQKVRQSLNEADEMDLFFLKLAADIAAISVAAAIIAVLWHHVF